MPLVVHPVQWGVVTSVTSEVTLGTELCLLLVQQEISFLFLWLAAALWLISCKILLSLPLGGISAEPVCGVYTQQTKQTQRLGENLPFHGAEHSHCINIPFT